jgi:hypothetical protein
VDLKAEVVRQGLADENTAAELRVEIVIDGITTFIDGR